MTQAKPDPNLSARFAAVGKKKAVQKKQSTL
jgi:hypothetical protein